MIRYAKKLEKTIWESAFDKKKKKPGLKFNPGLALTGVQATGPRSGPNIHIQILQTGLYTFP